MLINKDLNAENGGDNRENDAEITIHKHVKSKYVSEDCREFEFLHVFKYAVKHNLMQTDAQPDMY